MSKTKTKKSPPNPMLVGFHFSYYQDKSPLDFLTDKETGRRPGTITEPSGQAVTDLSKGVYGMTIPPLKIWNDGFWWDEWEKCTSEEEGKAPNPVNYNDRNLYVVSGEGTPGNYKWRLYLVPDEIAKQQTPKHPMLWLKKFKEGVQKPDPKPSTLIGFGKPAAPAPPTSTTSSIPYGVAFRCVGCGHWFKNEKDLSTHVQFTCPGAHGENDWAIMCADLCGCKTYDDVAKCKPGYPKKAEHPKAKEADGEVKPAEEITQILLPSKTAEAVSVE